MNFSIADKLENVRKRIQKATNLASREPDSVDLLAVSKKKPAEMVYEAYLSGQRFFGENYLNEALDKQEELQKLCKNGEYDEIEWHFIGPIQSNKTRAIAESFPWVHGVDRLKIAQRLNDQRPKGLAPLNICIQVNIDEEESKSGVLLCELDSLLDAIRDMPNLCFRGLMCIPKAGQTDEELSGSFNRMQRVFNELKKENKNVDTLSMGMSGDIESAIIHGSTMVRVGTAIFGERLQ